MTLSAPQQIFSLLKDLWEKIDHATPDPKIIESFKFYVARSPAAKFHLALISEMEIDLANQDLV